MTVEGILLRTHQSDAMPVRTIDDPIETFTKFLRGRHDLIIGDAVAAERTGCRPSAKLFAERDVRNSVLKQARAKFVRVEMRKAAREGSSADIRDRSDVCLTQKVTEAVVRMVRMSDCPDLQHTIAPLPRPQYSMQSAQIAVDGTGPVWWRSCHQRAAPLTRSEARGLLPAAICTAPPDREGREPNHYPPSTRALRCEHDPHSRRLVVAIGTAWDRAARYVHLGSNRGASPGSQRLLFHRT